MAWTGLLSVFDRASNGEVQEVEEEEPCPNIIPAERKFSYDPDGYKARTEGRRCGIIAGSEFDKERSIPRSPIECPFCN